MLVLHRKAWKGSAKFKLWLCHAIKKFKCWCLVSQRLSPWDQDQHSSVRMHQALPSARQGSGDTGALLGEGRDSAVFSHRWQSRPECVPALGTQFSAVAAEVGSCLIWHIHGAPAPFPPAGTAHVLIWGGLTNPQGALHSPLSKSCCLPVMGNYIVMGPEDSNSFTTAQIWGSLFGCWVGLFVCSFGFWGFFLFFVANVWTCSYFCTIEMA